MKLKHIFSLSTLCLTMMSAHGQNLCDKNELSIGDTITLTAPESAAKSIFWTLPKGYRLIGNLTDKRVKAEVTYYAQSGNVTLTQKSEDETETSLNEKIRVLRPISKIKDHTINDREKITIGGVERSEADIYYETTGEDEITAHRLTVIPESNRKIMPPYLQTASANSIYICWKSTIKENATIRFGQSRDKLDLSVTATYNELAGNYFWYSTYLTGLTANTIYYYQVESREAYGETAGKSEIFRLKTAPEIGDKKTKSRVLLMGDHQIKSRSGYEWLMQAAKRKIEEKYGQPIEEVIDLILNVGDQVDLGTLQQYEEIHFHKSKLLSPYIATMTAMGNHETYSDPGLKNYSTHFHYENLAYKGIQSHTENYYAYQYGRTLYVYLSSEHPGNTQKAWVRQVVDSVKTDETVDFVISVNHRPIQAEQYIGDISGWIRNEIVPILSETPKHVLNYGGHHHLYHRGQFANYPMYHIINGGASWDQMWGMSSEMDYNDVQKTIDFWAYQIVEFDYETKTMRAECYAIGNKMLVVDNILIDSFSRQFNRGAPLKPTLNKVDSIVTLPYTFSASEYKTNTEFALNTVQYQISTNTNFSLLEKDIIRDVENLYGSTKNPLYLPIDINERLDITRLEMAENTLKNGLQYIRVRYRDENMEWSEWSDTSSFEVQGSVSGEPTITIAKNIYAPKENIIINYEFAPEGKNAWIGLYKKGDNVGTTHATLWKYTSGASGQMNLGGLSAANEYFVVLFKDGDYEEATKRIPLYVGPSIKLKTDKSEYEVGEKIQIISDSAPALSKDWIGIYGVGKNPGTGNQALLWAYTTKTTDTLEFANSLPKGYYYAAYMLLEGYFEPSERVYFSVGNKISSIASDKTSYTIDEDILITYKSGPGTPKDWIGLYQKDKNVEVDELDGFYYTYGETDGTITIPAGEIKPDDYFLSFFINDSYTEVSERINISINEEIITSLSPTRLDRLELVYPNPFDSELFFNNSAGKYEQIIISTVLGKLILIDQVTDGHNIINVNNLQSGSYIVTLVGSQERKSCVLVKGTSKK